MSSAVYPSINPWALREEGGLINNLTAMHIITVFALEGVSFFPLITTVFSDFMSKVFHIFREAAEEFVQLQEES